jgi:hypothetical protein
MARMVDADRLAAARQVMLMLRRSPSLRATIAAHESGERPILIALIDDPLEEVVDRIHGIGLPVTLVVPSRAESPTVMTVRAGDPEHDDLWEPAPTGATIGLVVSHFRKNRPVAVGVPGSSADHKLILQLVDVSAG